ncbi:hypothetical protein R84981_002765 [Carnimonas sp. R-84981]|uniref:hypothetical protein n=1 Tax=Carnimonas bestiolae TaxID=3402172 RepID=UPI003EDC0B4C
MMNWLTKEQIVERFCFGDDIMSSWVSLPSLAEMISRAMVLDGHEITELYIWNEVIRPSIENDGIDFSIGGDVRYQIPTVVYMHYADWVDRIGILLGQINDCDIQPEWTDSNPCTHTVVKAMANVAVKVSKAASKAYEQANGHSMMEVFAKSLETGEDFDQSRARLIMERRGLQSVH